MHHLFHTTATARKLVLHLVRDQLNVCLFLEITLFSLILLHGVVVFLRELTLLWSKLQRRNDASLESFFERCLQFGAIAKTIYHLLFLVRVIQTEVNTYLIYGVYHELAPV